MDLGHGFGPGAVLLERPAPNGIRSRTHRHAIGHPVQPGAELMDIAQRVGLSDQDQERRLERVIDVGGVGEQPAADAQHHRTVPIHEGLQGGFVAIGLEPRQKLALIQAGRRPALEQPVNVPESGPIRLTGHTASRFDGHVLCLSYLNDCANPRRPHDVSRKPDSEGLSH